MLMKHILFLDIIESVIYEKLFIESKRRNKSDEDSLKVIFG